MEVDLHALAVRVMYLYSKYDGNYRNTKIMAVESGAEIPESELVGSRVPTLFSTTLKTTLFKLERFSPPCELSVETFFGPGIIPDKIKTQEDYFWTVILQYSCTSLTIAMKKVVDSIGSGNFYAWLPNPADGLKKTYLDPSAVGILKVFFIPRELNVTVTAYPEYPGLKDRVLTTEAFFPGQDSAVHECILLQDKFVVDPAGMQFGHRGCKNELVGHTVSLDDYITRFKGDVLTTRPRTEEDLFGEYCWTDGLIDKIVDHLMGDLKEGRKWCSYCGKGVTKFMSRCGRCKSVSYCGEYCQKSDWAGHKPICAAVAQAIPVSADVEAGNVEPN